MVYELKTTEHQIQQAIMGFLQYKGYYVQRMNSGKIPMIDKYGSKRMIQMSRAGTPDILAFKAGCVHHSQDHVELLFIEVKRPGNKPTILQKQMMEELESFGAKCIVATSIEDVEKAL